MRKATGVAVLLWWSLTAAADVSLTVWTGAGGVVRLDSVVPVLVQIQNDDRSRSGALKAGFRSASWPGMWVSEPLDLAPQARKRVFLYVPLQMYATGIVVRYETAQGRRIAEFSETVQPTESGLPAMAAVGEWPGTLPPARMGSTVRYTALQLRSEILPDRWEGLEMYDAILVTPPPAEPLTTPQVEALEGWVLRGGVLVVDVSKRTEAFAQGPLRDLLPLAPAGIDQRRFSELGAEMTYATGPVRGDVLMESDGVPLVVRRNHGLGSVVSFAFDVSDPGFRDWPRRDRLWQDLLGRLRFDRTPEEIQSGIFTGGPGNLVQYLMSSVSEERSTPLRLGLVLLLTALYALAVGPGDYFLVRRLGNPKLTWITFPLIVGVFTIAAYAGAKAWVGGEMSAKGVQRLLVFSDQGRALRFDLASLFVPEGAEYDIRHADEVYFRNLRGLFDPESPYILDQKDQRLLHRIPVWTRRFYIASQEVPAPEIGLTLQIDGDTATARIENRSGQSLTDCVLFHRRFNRLSLTDIPPGETLEVPLTRSDNPAWSEVPSAMDVSGKGLVASLDLPLGRELDARDALRRGALLLHARLGTAANPLVVQGVRRPEQDPQVIEVVTYPGGQT